MGTQVQHRLDWSHGPIPCSGCERPMRPVGRPADDPRWSGTVAHSGHGMCYHCRRATQATEAAESVARAVEDVVSPRPAAPSLRRLAGLEADAMVASPSLGREVTWPWRMLPGGMSMVQQELECLADLADQLRREGLVAMSRPRRSVRHGVGATILLTLTVRPATPAEARLLGHEPQPGDSAGVAA